MTIVAFVMLLGCLAISHAGGGAMNLLAFGCSYRTTPVEVREKLAFDDAQLARALDHFRALPGHEAVILSTCNRVEVYVGEPGNRPGRRAAGGLPRRLPRPARRARSAPTSTSRAAQEAVRHLFRVAASLDSLVVGEGQIAGQVKKAYERALAPGQHGAAAQRAIPPRPRGGPAGPQ